LFDREIALLDRIDATVSTDARAGSGQGSFDDRYCYRSLFTAKCP
jgi:hypothetical protein